jgi:hypothetical protein
MTIKDPDDNIVAIFKNHAVLDEVKSVQAGRPIYYDEEIVELHYPGSKNWSSHPAASFSHWVTDQLTGAQSKITYAERFRRQYQQFKAHATQTKIGTPLQYAKFLTEARCAELRAQNVYTIEALASIDGQELKNLGPGGRTMKNAAIEYIEESQRGAVNTQMAAELEALRAENQLMKEDLIELKEKVKPQAKTMQFDPADEFDGLTPEQLRDYITSHTGAEPKGALNRKTLLRMARDARPEKASAA